MTEVRKYISTVGLKERLKKIGRMKKWTLEEKKNKRKTKIALIPKRARKNQKQCKMRK